MTLLPSVLPKPTTGARMIFQKKHTSCLTFDAKRSNGHHASHVDCRLLWVGGHLARSESSVVVGLNIDAMCVLGSHIWSVETTARLCMSLSLLIDILVSCVLPTTCVSESIGLSTELL